MAQRLNPSGVIFHWLNTGALLVAVSAFGVIACIFRSVWSHFTGVNPGIFCKTPLDVARFPGDVWENVKKCDEND